ncbi:MAG TPA: MarR family transcriptional regulator [Acidimicrobiales bacterium]|jgi:DNA-binding MarR family transcriptional regulator
MASKKSPTPPRSEDLADAFFSVFHGLRRAVDRRFQHTPYSMARLRVLFQLTEQEAMRMGELSTCIEVAPRTMTSTIEAMERDGLVRRSPDPADGRAIIVTITDKGREAFAEGKHMKNSVVADLFDILDADQRTELAEILARLDEAVDTANSAAIVVV